MKTPIIITNFKTYQTATSDQALKLAKIHEEVARETGVSFAIAVSALDLTTLAKSVSIPVFSQHVDPAGYGGYTGQIPAELVKKAGGVGTLLNHSERRIRLDVLEESVKKAKEANLKVCICANTAQSGQAVAALDPDFVAVEPPELIGGDLSVTSADPDIITESVTRVGSGKLLVGDGIKNGQDVKKALELGAAGILLASGVTKAENPREVLLDLARACG